MSFFSKLITVTPNRKGKKEFERARRAELLDRYEEAKEHFETAAAAYDEYFAELQTKGKDARPSELVMAGISYTRLNKSEAALKVLDECIRRTEIPDAFLHAGFAAAQLGQLDRTIQYWTDYPQWVEQKLIHAELKKQLRQLRGPNPDLGAACDTLILTIYRQDKENRHQASIQHRGGVYPPNRGY